MWGAELQLDVYWSKTKWKSHTSEQEIQTPQNPVDLVCLFNEGPDDQLCFYFHSLSQLLYTLRFVICQSKNGSKLLFLLNKLRYKKNTVHKIKEKHLMCLLNRTVASVTSYCVAHRDSIFCWHIWYIFSITHSHSLLLSSTLHNFFIYTM